MPSDRRAGRSDRSALLYVFAVLRMAVRTGAPGTLGRSPLLEVSLRAPHQVPAQSFLVRTVGFATSFLSLRSRSVTARLPCAAKGREGYLRWQLSGEDSETPKRPVLAACCRMGLNYRNRPFSDVEIAT